MLFIPVGGYFTIEPDEAVYVTKQISPKIVIPMHYAKDGEKYPDYNLPIKGVDVFLNLIGEETYNMDILDIGKDTLPEKMQVIVLKEKV